MIFLLGRQAMLGQEPPIYLRSITIARIPFLARLQAMYLPASPLPSTTTSYSSVVGIDSVSFSNKESVDHIDIRQVWCRSPKFSRHGYSSPWPDVRRVPSLHAEPCYSRKARHHADR